MDRYTRPDLAHAALLSIDVQRDVCDGGPLDFASPTSLLPDMVRVVEAFRAAGRPIVHVVRLYQPDGTNADLCRRAVLEGGNGALVVGTAGAELVAELLPDAALRLDVRALLGGRFQPVGAHETVMYKPRWGAFYGTPLARHLRGLDVNTVVVIGCNFPNCPRATIVEASERDLRVAAVSDALSRFTERDAIELHDIGVAVMTAAGLAARIDGERSRAVTGSR